MTTQNLQAMEIVSREGMCETCPLSQINAARVPESIEQDIESLINDVRTTAVSALTKWLEHNVASQPDVTVRHSVKESISRNGKHKSDVLGCENITESAISCGFMIARQICSPNTPVQQVE